MGVPKKHPQPCKPKSIGTHLDCPNLSKIEDQLYLLETKKLTCNHMSKRKRFSLNVCEKIIQGNLINKIKDNISLNEN